MQCKVCGAKESDVRPEPSMHLFTIDFVCGASVDIVISDGTEFWNLESCSVRQNQILADKTRPKNA